MYVRAVDEKDFFSSVKKSLNPAYEANQKILKRLKNGVWLYFWLLMFEGALRKWILPQLATPLLIIRDPIAIWLLVNAYRNGLVKRNGYITLMFIIGVTSMVATLTMGHGNLSVMVYGERILLLHFPLMFTIGSLLRYEDVIKIGKAMIWLTIPMTVLMVLQFFSPQSAWVNRGVGGDIAGAGFNGGAFGYFRPPGTFSFTTGLVGFYNLLAAFILFFWINNTKIVQKWLLMAATGCLLAAIPLSISRSLLFGVILSTLFMLVIAFKKRKEITKILFIIFCGAGIMLMLSKLDFFKTGIEVFTSRFETASEAEGGLKGTLGNRFLGGLVSALTQSDDYPFWGLGIGMGTNAGAKILTGTAEGFLISEGEWGRLIGEMGIVLGLLSILIRIRLCVQLSFLSFKRLKHKNFFTMDAFKLWIPIYFTRPMGTTHLFRF